ncbi:MAG: DUF4157 domain-containing protein [Deltaproteobacteria bacterium]|nr:DUF4157 domain-containing protein [Deltaproteobacteria bacterium]
MIQHQGSEHAAQSADVDVAPPVQERQDNHGQDHHAAPAGGASAAAASWAPMQQRAMSRHGSTLAGKLQTPTVPLPFKAELEAQFGESLDRVEAHVGEGAAVKDLGGRAAAEGDVVAFADGSPDRATVAHEITHVLQARSGKAADHTGAEAEANKAKENIEAGKPVGPVTQGAAGIHLDSGAKVDQELNAREFLQEMMSVEVIAFATIHASGVLKKHPMAPFLTGDLEMGMIGYGSPANALSNPFSEKIDGLIAPEPVETIVDKARAARTKDTHGTGPAHHVYISSVGAALGNALVRKLQQSLTRMMPRLVHASKPRFHGKDMQGKDSWGQDAWPAASDLVVSHPMDRVVAIGLTSQGVKVDIEKFMQRHPGLVDIAAGEVRGPRTEPIKVRFPWERNLWHWVEAEPADATAQEVAKVLFGNEDQAYRLSPMAPLFGFRASDVQAFLPDKRRELEDLAAAHHPNPKVANQGAIDKAQHENDEEQKRRDERKANFVDDGTPLDGGLPPGSEPPLPALPAAAKVYPVDKDVDPALELAEAQGGEKLSKQRAKVGADAGKHDQANVYERATDCIDLIPATKTAFLALGINTETLDKFLAELHKKKRESVDMCWSDPEGEYALVNAQAKAMKRISKGAGDAAAHLALYGGVSKNNVDAGASIANLPDFAKEPLKQAGEAFASAVAALAFPELAIPRIEEAEYQTKMIRVAVLEQSLHETRPTLQGSYDTPDDKRKGGADVDPRTMESWNGALLMDLSRARVDLEVDPVTAEKNLAKTQESAGDYSFEVAVLSNLEALDAMWSGIEGSEDFWKDGLLEVVGNAIQLENDRIYKKFNKDILEPYRAAVKEKDQTKKDAAKKAFKDLVEGDELKKHFEKVKEHLKDTAKQKKWTKIIVGIAIAVVAMGLGQWYFGAYLAAGGGVVAASVGAAVVETGVSAVLSKIILDVDPTAGSLITGLVGGGAMYAVLGRALTIGRAAGAGVEAGEAVTKATLLSKAGKLAGDLTKEMIMVQAIGMVQGQIANLIDHGKLLTEEQLKEMFIHNVAGLVGMKIGQRVVDVTIDPMKPLRQLGRKNSIDIDALETQQKELIKLAGDVDKATDPATRKALSEQLIQGEKAFYENVRETRDKLIELAEKNPGKISEAKLKDLKSMGEHVQDPETLQAQAMISLEEVGPNLYRADAKAFDAILATHKQGGDTLIGVHTDQVTGTRSLEFKGADGSIVKVKEKLGNVGERNAPPVPAAEAKRFEDWIETAVLHPDVAVAATQRQRLRDYYARDPQGAMHVAEKHGFKPASLPDSAPLAPKPGEGVDPHPTVRPKSEADRAYDQHLHEQAGDKSRTQSRLGDEPTMSRSDFEAMYKAGFEYDPLTKRWLLADGKMAAGNVGKLPPELTRDVTTVVGSVHSEAVGHQMLRKLVNGEAEALRAVGIEPPPGFDSRKSEWALGRRESDGEIVLIKGDKGEVNWADIPGVKDIAHSHPLYDPVTGQPRLISGAKGDGTVNIHDLASFDMMDLIHLMPSTGDLRFVALNGRGGHRLHTPYVSLGKGKIGNPVPGHNYDVVEFVIAKSEPHALNAPGSSMIVWKAKLEVWAGNERLGEITLYQKRLDEPGFKADLPTVHPEAQWVTPVPADHPVHSAMPQTMQTGSHTNIGHVSADAVGKLLGMKINLEDTGLHTALGGLTERRAQSLEGIIEHARPGGRITEGFPNMLERIKTEPNRVAEDMVLIKHELDADPSARVKFDANGKPVFSSNTRADMPGDVVGRSRSAAGGVKPKLDKFEIPDAVTKDAMADRVQAQVRKEFEDTYAAAIKNGDSHDAALKAATAHANKKVMELGEKAALDYAAAQARDAIANNTAFGTVDAPAQAAVGNYKAGTVGMRGRALISTLPRSEAAFLKTMATEVTSHGATPSTANIAAPTTGMPAGSPVKQTMHRWEYPDGTVVRYKPLGDDHRPNVPSFSIEVKKNPAIPDSAGGSNGVALKLDDTGRAAPRTHDGELANPFTNDKQHKAFDNAAMEAVHHELTRP